MSRSQQQPGDNETASHTGTTGIPVLQCSVRVIGARSARLGAPSRERDSASRAFAQRFDEECSGAFGESSAAVLRSRCRGGLREVAGAFEVTVGTEGEAEVELYEHVPRSTSWHHVSRSVTLRGVGFSDIPHGQTGASTNGI
jgi:hypothetical protein